MNVIYATIRENPAWSDWANGDQLHDAPVESIVEVMLSGVSEPLLTLECENFVGHHSSDRAHQEAIANTLREFFAQVQSHVSGG